MTLTAAPPPRPPATPNDLASVIAKRNALKDEPTRAQKMAAGWAAAAATVTAATVATSVFSTRDDLKVLTPGAKTLVVGLGALAFVAGVAAIFFLTAGASGTPTWIDWKPDAAVRARLYVARTLLYVKIGLVLVLVAAAALVASVTLTRLGPTEKTTPTPPLVKVNDVCGELKSSSAGTATIARKGDTQVVVPLADATLQVVQSC